MKTTGIGGGENQTEKIGDVIFFSIMGLWLTISGFISYRSGLFGGLPPLFIYWEGKTAKVFGILTMIIGIPFLIATIATLMNI